MGTLVLYIWFNIAEQVFLSGYGLFRSCSNFSVQKNKRQQVLFSQWPIEVHALNWETRLAHVHNCMVHGICIRIQRLRFLASAALKY